MSLLPQQILPVTEPLANVDANGQIIISKNWWLLIYALCGQVLGTPGSSSGSGGVPADALLDFTQSDLDAVDSDATSLRKPIQNLQVQVEDYVPYAAQIPAIGKNTVLAQNAILPDPTPVAQPALVVTPGASPYSFVAPFNGQVAVTGGTVSAIALSRQGTTVATGLTLGTFMVSRGDSLVITYSGVPTVTFLPT
jgi:hypothetical protein